MGSLSTGTFAAFYLSVSEHKIVLLNGALAFQFFFGPFLLQTVTFKKKKSTGYRVHSHSSSLTRSVRLRVDFCLSASCIKTSSSCGPFPPLYVKPVNKTQSHGKSVDRAAERNVLFCEKARHWRNFKEKLMDLFLSPILIEQSADPGAVGPSLCWK